MASVEIKGLDRLQKQLNEAQAAFSELDGHLTTVKVDPNDPASIEQAIKQVNQVIDAKTQKFHGNAIVEKLAKAMKERYREGLIAKAREARLTNNDAD